MEYYIVFALTTAIIGTFSIFRPLMESLREIRPTHNMCDFPFLSYTTFFLIMLVVAPVVFVATIIPSISAEFKDTMLNTLISEAS